MRKIVLVSLMLLASGLMAVPSAAAAASSTSCSVVWGSLLKTSDLTTTGPVTGVRTGRHRCYDRFVVDLKGPKTGYLVQYVDELTADGSGLPVPVTGGAIIQVVVHAPAHDDNGHATLDGAKVDAMNVAGYQTFRDIAWANTFEGFTTMGIGVRARLPVRVFSLAGPGNGSRLVIDVAHRW